MCDIFFFLKFFFPGERGRRVEIAVSLLIVL